jgi:exosortase/archaeosortase family protein
MTLVRVAITFVVIYALLQTTLWTMAYRGYFDPVVELTADMTGTCSNLMGVPATVTGNEVRLPSRVLRIDVDCTGVSLMVIYAALVLAYPLNAKRKLIGLGVGLPALFMANALRLMAVAQSSERLGDRAFLFVHDYLFKIIMVGVVIAAWAFYLVSAKRHAT